MIRFSFLILCFFTASLQAAPQIAAHLRLRPTPDLTSTLSSECPPLHTLLQTTGHLEVFLLLTPENALQPVIFTKTEDTTQLPEFMKAFAFAPYAGWQVGSFLGARPADTELAELLLLCDKTTPTPIFASITPALVLQSLTADANFVKKIQGTPVEIFFQQFGSLQAIQLRVETLNSNLRAVVLFKAAADTPLYSLFSQRLPSQLPAQHARIPTAAAAGFGYSLFNTNAIRLYWESLKELATQKNIPDFPAVDTALLSQADGYSAFLISSDLQLQQYLQGQWNSSTAADFIRSSVTAAASFESTQPATVKQSFIIGDAPVWKITQPNSSTSFAALVEGDLLLAPTAESITSLVETLQSQETPSAALSSAFVQLPTLAGQTKLYPARLAQGFKSQFPFGADNIPADLPNNPIYMAASLGEGRLAITADIPFALINRLGQRLPATNTHQ